VKVVALGAFGALATALGYHWVEDQYSWGIITHRMM
jgi:hypothetical protein